MTGRAWFADGVIAGVWAGALGGFPSTLVALARGTDPLEATRAAGTLLLPHDQRDSRLLPAAAVVHGTLSLGWAVALARLLPRNHLLAASAAAGLGIAALDLGVLGRAFPRVHALPLAPQVADHLTFAIVAGLVIERRRRARAACPRRAC